MEKVVTYTLLGNSDNSDDFYSNLIEFTDCILQEASLSLGLYVDDYYDYIINVEPETPRSKDEYLLELIMIGIFWRNYIHKAEKTNHLSKVVLKKLYSLRKANPTLKPMADKVRGYLAYELLNTHKNSLIENFTLEAYTHLLEWLSATGEFNEEVIRLTQWTGYYKTKTEKELETILQSIISFSNKFSSLGKEMLGKYTVNAPKFLDNSLKEYAYREDYFFTGRRENEYFLNMFGAEIMNRQLRAEFEHTSKKAVLLPTCMRIPPKSGCKATSDGKELVCVRCNKDCNIGKVAKALNDRQVTPYLIPHSSDFSRFLIKWKDDRETGLIGVACVLNLLTGGYEMKRLHIASQCVFLDYCGCKKHWDKDGFATNLNCSKLQKIIEKTDISVSSTMITS